MFKFYSGIASLLLVLLMMSCQKDETYGSYKGVPKDLRYSGIVEGGYIVGESYVSKKPTIFSYGETTYEIVNITTTTDVPKDILMESVTISNSDGIIRILPFTSLVEGDYSVDIKVTNNSGSTTFIDAYDFSAITGAPNYISYSPSIVSYYTNELGVVSSLPQVTGGGPYQYSFTQEEDNFTIDPLTGVISYTKDLLVGPQDRTVNKLFVSVSNSEGSFTSTTPFVVEVIGSNIGRLAYIMEFSEPSSVSFGITDCDIVNYYGEVTETIGEEDYTTVLTPEKNGPIWKGSTKSIPYFNVFFSDLFRIKYDISDNGTIVETPTLGMSTTNTKTEAISLITFPSVDLANVTEAYINIEGFKRYLDNDLNQHLVLMITKEDDFNSEDNFESNWTILDPNIASILYQMSGTTANESDIKNSGSSTFQIPAEFYGTNVKVALKGVYLKPPPLPGGSNLGREYHISKFEIRTKQ